MNDPSKRSRWLQGGLTLLLLLVAATPAAAFKFTLGEVQGSLDTTLSYGLSYRVAERDQAIIGTKNGGTAYSVNGDDGNLNYDDDEFFSKVLKVTSDLELKYENYGLFVRGTAFYDYVNVGGDGGERTAISDKEALRQVGKGLELLDAYVWWDFDLGDMPGTLRVGDQVVSWGESTFLLNGINTINPLDISKLRMPGSELKEGLIPVGMVSASLAANEYVSFEGFYQYNWEKTEADPLGSYWSTTDLVGEGAQKVLLGWGAVADNLDAPAASTFLAVPRGPDIYADDSGQYGVAMRLYSPTLNNTEFGFYFMNYHSRLPVLSSRTGTLAGLGAASTINTAVNAPATGGGAIDIVSATLSTFTGANSLASIMAGAAAKGSNVPTNAALLIGQTALQKYAETYAALVGTYGSVTADSMARAGVNAAASTIGAGVGKAFAQDAYGKTAQYQVEYPEDIKLLGVSFNTTLQDSGVALQGEVSHRLDVPLQVDDVELLLATMEPLANPVSNAGYSQYDHIVTATEIALNGGQSIYIPGYKRLDMTQVQVTGTKTFGPSFGADQFTLVGEVGLTYVHNMPSKNQLRFESPGTYVSGNPAHSDVSTYPLAAHDKYPAEPASAFADATSWGYRAVAKLDFNNAIGAVTLSPRIAWAHDVSGNSPGPGGNFLEDRKAITFGLGADYQNTWSADLSYTDYFGAGRYNLINDRDFVSFNVKYSF